MKTLAQVKKDYTADDWRCMKNGLRKLEVFDNITGQRVKKNELKRQDAETYRSGVYRATFHFNAVRLINGKEYYFKNKYLFEWTPKEKLFYSH